MLLERLLVADGVNTDVKVSCSDSCLEIYLRALNKYNLETPLLRQLLLNVADDNKDIRTSDPFFNMDIKVSKEVVIVLLHRWLPAVDATRMKVLLRQQGVKRTIPIKIPVAIEHITKEQFIAAIEELKKLEWFNRLFNKQIKLARVA